jgi:ubiquitin-conjugating enzyme E2 O
MTTTESTPQLHVDDVCTSNSSNQLAVGYVDRTHAEVESHTPYPINTYGKVHRHKAVPRQLYKEFLRDGVPPEGFVLMQWQTESKAELVPCSDLLLLDRSFMSGDLVRKGNRSGTVVSTRTRCTLLSMCDVRETKSHKTMKCAWLPLPAEEEPSLELVNDGGLLYDIPASELKLVQTFNEGDIIIYKNWIGRIKDCFDEVTVRLSDNGVVSIADEGKLEPMSGDPEERFAVGSLVRTKKGVLRTGRWVFGTYSPNTPPIGVVVDVRTKECQVDWLHPRMERASEIPIWSSAPDGILGPDELESDEVRLYDISSMPTESSPTAARSDPELQGGLRVRFKDLPEACAKYDGSGSHGKLEKLDRTQSLGYDLNVFTITSTTTAADVLWSDDSTIETVRTTSIIPDPSIDDEDAVFAGEVVCTNETREPPPEAMTSWAITPARVGIANQVNSRDRVAHVTWFKDSTLSFCDKSLDLPVPNTKFGTLGEEQEEVSFYDIRAPKSVNRNRGDYVLLLKIPPLSHTEPNSINWFGEIVDLGRNGQCTVRLGAAEPVQEVECDITDTAPAMNLDVDDHPHIDDGNEDYEFSDELDDVDLEMGQYSDSESEEDIWFEDGQDIPIDDADDSWSTEDEENDNSDAMSTQDDTPGTNIIPPSAPITPSTQPAQVGNVDNSTDRTMSDFPVEEMRLSSLPNAPAAYEILESEVPSGHHYLLQTGSTSAHHMKGVSKEHKILSAPGALPEGVYVRTWESRMDLIRVLFVGPLGTPYEYAPFMIDLHLPSQYPYEPPKAFFHSWTAEGAGMSGRVNPNLYEEGKICLSLLGTWQGDEARNEAWSPHQSTVLQVLVSILGLVLVREPYYNEAGFEPLQGLSSINQNSVAYTERTYLRARAFLISPVSRLGRGETAGLEGLENVLRWLYTDADGAKLLPKATSAAHTILRNSEDGAKVEARDGLSVVSRGAALPLKRVVARLEQLDQEASSQTKD